jgi:hypothetical protein
MKQKQLDMVKTAQVRVAPQTTAQEREQAWKPVEE